MLVLMQAAGEIPPSGAEAVLLGWTDRFPLLSMWLGLAVLFLLAAAALLVVQRLVLRLILRVTRRTSAAWDEILFDSVVFQRLSWLVPLVIVRAGIHLVPNLPPTASEVVDRVAVAVMILVTLRTIGAALDVVNTIYNRFPTARDRPIKGLLQVVMIVLYLIGGILILATLMNESPVIFFSGIGAMTAILMLVFRDSILSLVAGVQLTANNLIRVGDWIEMPQFDADGDVVDIALNTVSVQNWDKTITVIPTHKFLEHSFRNWRGMQESGGRRIKRAVHIDMSTVRFLSEEEIARFRDFLLLREYVDRKVEELEQYNREHNPDPEMVVNARRLTNLGMLRAYVAAYLHQHPMIHQKLTFLVRQLAPGPEGLPLEIYVFVNDVRWAVYEGVQSDIFDHILAIIPEFGLRVYQQPAGSDLVALSRGP